MLQHALCASIKAALIVLLMFVLSNAESTHFSTFGIFDGHGGKQAATYASKNLMTHVADYLDRCSGSPVRAPDLPHAADEDEAVGVFVTPQDKDVWAAQDALIERLPKVRTAWHCRVQSLYAVMDVCCLQQVPSACVCRGNLLRY